MRLTKSKEINIKIKNGLKIKTYYNKKTCYVYNTPKMKCVVMHDTFDREMHTYVALDSVVIVENSTRW